MHAMAKMPKRLAIEHTGKELFVEWDFRVDLVVPEVELQEEL